MYTVKKLLKAIFYLQLVAYIADLVRTALRYDDMLTAAPLWLHFLPTLVIGTLLLILTGIAYALVCRAIRKKERTEEV